MMRRLLSVAGLGLLAVNFTPSPATAAECTDNVRICLAKRLEKEAKDTSEEAEDHPSPASAQEDPYRYKVEPACGASSGEIDESDGQRCRYALTACAYATPPSDEVRYRFLRQLKSGGPWVPYDESCGLDDAPAGAAGAPRVPTMGDIQEAFVALPFAQPKVNIQPEGDVTLVNLPTYFEAQWAADGLEPGEISKTLKLFSWLIEFKIAPATYNYDFGDGTRSGATKDVGGPYPEGNIRHTYDQPNPAAKVKVDAQLTGWFRVNGGAWEPIDTVADLQDEPVVTLQVREAKSRLYNN